MYYYAALTLTTAGVEFSTGCPSSRELWARESRRGRSQKGDYHISQEGQEAEQLLSQYTEVWNEQDYSRIPDIVSESFTAILPDEEYHGHDGLEEWIEETTSAFPDFHVEPVDVVASEETVMTDAKFTMTHEREYEGIPPTGEEIEVQQMAKFSVEDGKLEEHRQDVDRQGIAEQLGVTEG